MGACGSSLSEAEKVAAAENAKIEKLNKEDVQREKKKIKLLLLGAGESGKSTLFKQMKRLYGIDKEYTPQELQMFKDAIASNIFQDVATLLENSTLADAELEGIRNELISMSGGTDQKVINEKVAEMISKVWQDEGVREAWEERQNFQVQDAFAYFCDNIMRIAEPEFIPNDDDILRSRIRTSGIVQENFLIDGTEFNMFDVGGQRNERKKWIHAFDNVHAVIFVAAINEYDQWLFEDNTVNRIDEAVKLFADVANNQFFSHTAMMLFLNKNDLFQEKLPTHPFKTKERFADFEGPLCDPNGPSGKIGTPEFEQCYNAAVEYLTDLFVRENKNPDRPIYTHVTCATDQNNVKKIFNASKDIILRIVLKEGFGV